jgi:Icc protein
MAVLKHSRRSFVKLGFKSVFVIGLGNSLTAFPASAFPDMKDNKLSFRFALASDGHWGEIHQPDPSKPALNTQWELHYDNMIAWLNEEKNKNGLDFVIMNGDLFHDNPAFLPEVKSKLDNLIMPFYVTHGNHDKVEEAIWKKTWNMSFNYVIEMDESVLLVLNTADEFGWEMGVNKPLYQELLNWTGELLNLSDAKKNLFIIMHIPFHDFEKGNDVRPGYSELIDLFNKQSNLKAVFHGHIHTLDGAYTSGGKHYFFDSHIAGSWGTAYNGYRIVEVFKSGEILTYQMNPIGQEKVNSDSLYKTPG